jgi:hypothetical protein
MIERIEPDDPAGQWLDELRAALGIEPSSELQARVRIRVRGERMRARPTPARLAGLICVAAATTFAVVPVTWRSTETPVIATNVVSAADESVRVLEANRAATAAPASLRPRAHGMRPAVAENRGTEPPGSSGPEVLVPSDQREGLRRILDALAEGRRLRAVVGAPALSGPLPDPEPIAIEPLYIAPLPGTPDPAVKGGTLR